MKILINDEYAEVPFWSYFKLHIAGYGMVTLIWFVILVIIGLMLP